MTLPKTMQAVVYRGPDDLRVETVPVPKIGPGEILVRVAACGVCPTDIKKIQHGTVPPPRIFGHETAGTVVKVGARVRGFRVGNRVALHHHVPCMDCHACRHRAYAQCAQYKRTGITAGFEPAGGGYAEFVRVMSFVLPGVVKIPAANAFEEGAMLEPVNTVLKAVRRLQLLPGDTVLVAGQGPIGLMFTRLLALEGMRVLASDLFAPRLKLARDFGATWTWQAQPSGAVLSKAGKSLRVREDSAAKTDRTFLDFVLRITKGRGVDAAVVAVPSDEVVAECLDSVRGAGQVLLFSHTRRGAQTAVDLASVCVDEKDLIGSYSADYTLQKEVARLVFSRKLDTRKLITHSFPLAETARAVALASRPQPDSLKIIVSHSAAS